MTGSRTWRWHEMANNMLRWPDGPVRLIWGGAKGADTIMMRHAVDQGWEVPAAWLPDYERYPRHIAPKLRNGWMVAETVRLRDEGWLAVCVALWRDHSGGTRHTMGLASQRGIPVMTAYDCDCHTPNGELR